MMASGAILMLRPPDDADQVALPPLPRLVHHAYELKKLYVNQQQAFSLCARMKAHRHGGTS